MNIPKTATAAIFIGSQLVACDHKEDTLAQNTLQPALSSNPTPTSPVARDVYEGISELYGPRDGNPMPYSPKPARTGELCQLIWKERGVKTESQYRYSIFTAARSIQYDVSGKVAQVTCTVADRK